MNLTGTLIILNKAQASASLLDLKTEKEIARITTATGPHEVAVSPDGKTAVICNYGDKTPGNSLSIINIENKSVTNTINLNEYHRPHGIVFLKDGKHISVTSEHSQKLLIINLQKENIIHAIDTQAQISHMVALTPNENRAFVANIGSGSVSVIDLTKHQFITEIITGDGTEGLDISPDGKQLWVANRGGDSIRIIDTESLNLIAEFPCPSFPIRVKFTPDGSRVLVSNARTGDLAVFDTKSRKEIKRINMNEKVADDIDSRLFSDRFGTSPVPVGILVEPKGNYAFVANTNADIVTVIDLNNLEITNRLRGGKEPDGLAWSPALITED